MKTLKYLAILSVVAIMAVSCKKKDETAIQTTPDGHIKGDVRNNGYIEQDFDLIYPANENSDDMEKSCVFNSGNNRLTMTFTEKGKWTISIVSDLKSDLRTGDFELGSDLPATYTNNVTHKSFNAISGNLAIADITPIKEEGGETNFFVDGNFTMTCTDSTPSSPIVVPRAAFANIRIVKQ